MKRSVATAKTPTWVRFDAYEIVGGYILPRHRARLERRPFPAADGNADVRAAQQLVRAIRGIELHDSGWPRRKPTKGEENALKEFASEYGLLGLLHHQTLSVAFAPRERVVVQDVKGRTVPFAIPYQLRFERARDGWRKRHVIHIEHDVPHDVRLDLDAGAAADDLAEVDTDVFESPRAILLPFAEESTKVQALATGWAPYFPKVPRPEAETYSYPAPGTTAFWKMYAEPVDEVVRAAAALAKIFQRLEPGTGRDLDWLVAPVGLLVRRDPFGLAKQDLATPSLLSALCLAALNATGSGWHLASCDGCSKPFFSRSSQARYCSTRCKRRIQTRRLRRKKAAKGARR
jgi:hypothetical protein